MWCVNPQCGFLDEHEPARPGVGSWKCPRCGEATFENARTATATAGTTATVEVTAIVISVWSAWARVAINTGKQAAEAKRSAAAALAGQSAYFKGSEYDAGMTAVAAAAFAIDGLYASEACPKAARDAVKARLAAQYAPDSPARHEVVREGLKEVFVTTGRVKQQWSADLKWLYSRRNPVVHSEERQEKPLSMPDGSLSTVKRENYNADAAARAVEIMLSVLAWCVVHPGTGYPETAEWATPNRRAAVENLQTWWRAAGWHPFDGPAACAGLDEAAPTFQSWLAACPLPSVFMSALRRAARR
ncbi:hypothetical protein ABIA31_007976 [Catenulispora sp. MAP5-51]